MKLLLPILIALCSSAWAEIPPVVVARVKDSGIEKLPGMPEKGWESVSVPAWYADARLGVMICWGPNSVPEYDLYGLYFRSMYTQGGNELKVYDYHCRVYGHPTRFGYKDLIPLWKGSAWKPDVQAEFFKKNRFKYLITTAAFHDNFDCYDSTCQSWNSVKMGIKRDVVGEWRSAADKAGLRFGVYDGRGVTGLLSRARSSDVIGFRSGKTYDGCMTAADGKGLWWEGYDPQELYFPFTDESSYDVYGKWWLMRAKELVDKYQPQLYFIDAEGLPFDENGVKFLSYYLDHTREPVVLLKGVAPQRALVVNYDINPSDQTLSMPWQTTSTLVNSWYYRPDRDYLDVQKAVQLLMDVVSRNGNLLLNVGLDAEGRISRKQRDTIEALGKWLKVNGEAVYGTHPWKISGSGPMRFTCKEGLIYVYMPSMPKETIMIPALGRAFGVGLQTKELKKVELLGRNDNIVWKLTHQGVEIQPVEVKEIKIPGMKARPAHPGYVFKLQY